MKIVIFDGPSGSGKTTLRYKLFHRLNFDILTIDRFTPSVWVYDKLRGIDREDVIEFEREFDVFEPLVVICRCDPKVARLRARSNDDLRDVVFDPNSEIKIFSEYVTKSGYSNVLELNTERNIEESIVEILNYL